MNASLWGSIVFRMWIAIGLNLMLSDYFRPIQLLSLPCSWVNLNWTECRGMHKGGAVQIKVPLGWEWVLLVQSDGTNIKK